MILAFPRFRLLSALALVTLTTLSARAATSKRHLVTPLPLVTITGTVTDSSSGHPVQRVVVANGVTTATTDAAGHYSLTLPANRPTLVTANYFAFKPSTKTVTPSSGLVVDFSLAPNPSITLKTTTGDTIDFDYDSSKFAYLIVFIGYVKDDNANFCKPDGSKWAPNKSEFSKIIGPGTMVSFSPCCTLGPIVTVNVEMKSGEKTAVYFVDSCFGDDVDFLGRDRSTGDFRYVAFKDIAEIDFP